jgi:5-methylcytosine-specific restriction endonuclease McrA
LRGDNYGDDWRATYEYKQWLRAIKLRDKMICQICGDIGTDCHHIKYAKDYPELRYNIDNGILLCMKCHKEIHYGGQINENC